MRKLSVQSICNKVLWGIYRFIINFNLQDTHVFEILVNFWNGNLVEEFKKEKKPQSCAEARGTLKWNERERCNESLTPGSEVSLPIEE